MNTPNTPPKKGDRTQRASLIYNYGFSSRVLMVERHHTIDMLAMDERTALKRIVGQLSAWLDRHSE